MISPIFYSIDAFMSEDQFYGITEPARLFIFTVDGKLVKIGIKSILTVNKFPPPVIRFH